MFFNGVILTMLATSLTTDISPVDPSLLISSKQRVSAKKRKSGKDRMVASEPVLPLVARKMSRRSLDCAPSLREILKDKKISLITEVIGGHGDVMGAAKIALYLQQKLGVDRNNIVLGIGLPDPPAILQNSGIPLANLTDDRLRNGDIVIVGPGIRQDFTPYLFVRNSQVPVLMIHEYGVSQRSTGEGNIRKDSLGLSEDSLGILLTPELLEWSSSEKTDIQRLQKLQWLPEYLQKEILGSEYSEASVESFARNSKLYFGYAHTASIQSSFLKAVASMNFQLHDPSDLYFYFMGNALPQFSESEVETLVEQGFGSIEYVRGNDPERKQTYKISDCEKKLKIITGPLDPADVNVMHMASEYETLATGDQSFSEAVSAGKIPTYEVYIHKIPFFKQFCNLLPEALQEKNISFYEFSNTFPISYDINAEKLAQFYVERRINPEMKNLIDLGLSEMRSHHQFGPKFEQVFYDLLRKSEASVLSNPL